MSLVIEAAGFGVVTAGVVALAAVGFTLQFAITNIFNVAVGSQLTLAAFIAYALNRTGVSIWYAMIAAGLFTGVTSVLLNRMIFQPFLRRGTSFFGLVVVGIALLLIIQFSSQAIWGASFVSYQFNAGGVFKWGPLLLNRTSLILLGIAAGTMVAVHLLLTYTRFGKSMRATAADPELASSCGIRIQLVTDATWFLAGMLSGLGGVAFGMTLGAFSVSMGSTFLVIIVAAAILGGVGQAYGAMLGALVVGIATEETSLLVSSAYSQVAAFIILILVLVVRPEGILPGVARYRGIAT